ncbi:MAG: ATPase P [Bacteroidales bacterium]|nr:ATPase P [Bacteroidales bacterium]
MITIDIPGRKTFHLEHLVLDFNGTLAIDGKLIEGVRERLQQLSTQLMVHVITADTFGTVANQLKGIDCQIKVLEKEQQDRQKKIYLKQLGKKRCAAIGNGYNDWQMLKYTALSIATIQTEGASTLSLKQASIVCYNVNHALDLLLNPNRLVATLRR